MEDDTPIETLISQVSFQLKWTLVTLSYVIAFREDKSKHTLPVLYGPTLGPVCLTVAVNSLPTIDLFLKVSPTTTVVYQYKWWL